MLSLFMPYDATSSKDYEYYAFLYRIVFFIVTDSVDNHQDTSDNALSSTDANDLPNDNNSASDSPLLE